MQVNLKSLVMVGVVGLVAVGGSLFGFQEVRKAEARTACESVTMDSDGKVELSQANAKRFDACMAGMKRLPFKNAEVQNLIEQSAKMSVLFHMGGAFMDGLKDSGKNSTVAPSPTLSKPVASPIASPVPAPAPIPEPDFASLAPCDQLDAVAKSGKSVSDFVVADWSRFGAVGGTCPWHQPQIETARLILFPPAPAPAPLPANRGSGRSVEPDYVPERRTVVVEREVPRYDPEPIPRYVPERRPVARVEGSCYHADPSQCPGSFNGNPHDGSNSRGGSRDNGPVPLVW